MCRKKKTDYTTLNTARVCLSCRNIEYLRKASKEKIFTDFIFNNSDENRKMSNLFVKICFDFNNNFYYFVSGKQQRKKHYSTHQ